MGTDRHHKASGTRAGRGARQPSDATKRSGRAAERDAARRRPLDRFSDQAVELVAFRCRLFGEPTRIRLLELLNDGEASVQELTDQLQTTHANASKHLSLLHQAGVVSRRKDGPSVRYALVDWTGWWLIEQLAASIADQLDELRGAFDRKTEGQ
jgi:DNA-binding transcriptional ArsR family regulator